MNDDDDHHDHDETASLSFSSSAKKTLLYIPLVLVHQSNIAPRTTTQPQPTQHECMRKVVCSSYRNQGTRNMRK